MLSPSGLYIPVIYRAPLGGGDTVTAASFQVTEKAKPLFNSLPNDSQSFLKKVGGLVGESVNHALLNGKIKDDLPKMVRDMVFLDEFEVAGLEGFFNPNLVGALHLVGASKDVAALIQKRLNIFYSIINEEATPSLAVNQNLAVSFSKEAQVLLNETRKSALKQALDTMKQSRMHDETLKSAQIFVDGIVTRGEKKSIVVVYDRDTNYNQWTDQIKAGFYLKNFQILTAALQNNCGVEYYGIGDDKNDLKKILSWLAGDKVKVEFL